jgi:flagellar hook-length control protein FliK
MMAATSLLTVAVTDASTLSASLPAKADGLLPLPPSSAAIPVPAISGADGIAVAALPWLALPVISPAGTSASVMTPPLPPVVLNAPDAPQQWGAQIEWSLKAGVQEARIEVHPQALGPVDVQLSMVDGGLKVHMSAAHAATRELLQEQLPRLRESLQSSGIVLTQAEVGQGAPRRDAPLPSRSARHRSNADDNSIGEVTAAPVWQRRVGLLDDYA